MDDDRKIAWTDAVVFAFVCSACAITLSFVVFSEIYGKLEKFSPGSAADWIAATGAIAIGIGANRYAKATIAQTEGIEASRNRAIDEQHNSALRSVRNIVARASVAAGAVVNERDSPLRDMWSALETLELVTRGLKWESPQLTCLSPSAIELILECEIRFVGFQHFANQVHKQIEDASSAFKSIPPELEELLRRMFSEYVATNGERVTEKCREFDEVAEKLVR